jgi:hypothetical protein
VALRELLARFGVEVDTKKLEAGDASVNSFSEKLNGLGQALSGGLVMGGLMSFTQGLVSAGDYLDKASLRLGVSTDELQAWEFAAERSGISAESMAGGMKLLYKNLSAAGEAGSQQAQDFAALKISLKDASGKAKPMTSILGELSDKIADTKDPTKQAGLALKFFGKSGLSLLPLLKSGADGTQELFDRFQDLGGGYSREFATAAAEAADAQTDLNIATKGAKNALGSILLPYVAKGGSGLADFIARITKAAKGTTIFRSILVAVGGSAMFGVIGSIAAAATKLGLLGGAAGGASGGILGLAKSIGTAGAALVRTMLPAVVLFLVFDDLMALFRGGDSVIGRFVDGLFGVGTTAVVVEMLKLGWQDFLAWVQALGPVMSAVWGFVRVVLQDAFNGFQGTTQLFAVAWQRMVVAIQRYWSTALSNVGHNFNQLLLDITNKIKSNPVLSAFFGTAAKLVGKIASDNLASEAADKSYLERRATALGLANGGDVSTLNQDITINVDGVEKPAEAAKAMQEKLQGATDNAARALGALKRP